MHIGDKARFAIEAEVTRIHDGWIFGHIRFWICGKAVGNWEDEADLGGCLRWLKDFSEVPRERVAPEIFSFAAKDVFRQVYDPVMAHTASAATVSAPTNAFDRFHITHLGMSSFDRFDVLLISDGIGKERCLWCELDGEISECVFQEGEMARVAEKFCRDFVGGDVTK